MKKLLTLFLALCFTSVSLSAQESEPVNKQVQDSVLYTTTFLFEKNQGEWIEKYDYAKVGRLFKWAEANGSALIDIKGWADQSGTEEFNARLSLKRAKAIQSYLVQKGIDSSRITFEGKGVDSKSDSIKARRADVVAYIRVATKTVVIPEPEEVVTIDVKELTDTTKTEDARAAKPIEEIDTEMQVEPEPETIQKPTTETTSEETTIKPTQQTELAPQPNREFDYYAGAGLGFMPTWSTFTGTGLNLQAFAGVEFTKLISAELSLGYSHINMTASHCCEDLYYVDGERFFTPVAGMKSYRYGDLTSKANLLHLGAKVNFDIVSLFVKKSVWSGLVSPKISYAQSWANVQNDKITINKESSPHFGVGVDLSGGYMINSNWGVRLTTGIEYLTGKGVDGMPQCEHNSNTLWNTNASVIYKF